MNKKASIMKFRHLIIVFSVFFIFNSCQSEIEKYEINNDDQQYFPLKIGNKWVYEVDSTIFDNKGTIKTTISRIVEETVINTYKDIEGQDNFIIEQNTFDNSQLIRTNIMNAYVTSSTAVRNEGNLNFIKLVFPILKSKTWDGNALFDSANTIVKIAGEPIRMYELWDYRYSETGITAIVNGIEYQDVVNVVQTDSDNKIEKRYSQELYAKGLGLIYKKMIILNTQKLDQGDTPWELKAEEGFILEQQLISYNQ